jgi:hypothetical protein
MPLSNVVHSMDLDASSKQSYSGLQLTPEQMKENRGIQLAAGVSVLFTVAFCLAISRFVIRIKSGQRAIDDIFLLLAVVSNSLVGLKCFNLFNRLRL